MMTRELRMDDLNEIKDIHEKYYKNEFELPDFCSKYLCAFVVTDGMAGKIITAGGVRTITESVIMTNKSFSPRDRVDALYETLDASTYFCGRSGYSELHAFVQGHSNWEKQLIRTGFKPTVGNSLVLVFPSKESNG